MNELAERYMRQMEDVVRNSDYKLYPAEGALTQWQEAVMCTYGRDWLQSYQEHAEELCDLEDELRYVFPFLDGYDNSFTISLMAAPMYAVRARVENAKDFVAEAL